MPFTYLYTCTHQFCHKYVLNKYFFFFFLHIIISVKIRLKNYIEYQSRTKGFRLRGVCIIDPTAREILFFLQTTDLLNIECFEGYYIPYVCHCRIHSEPLYMIQFALYISKRAVSPRTLKPWYSYQLVAQTKLRTCDGEKRIFF